MFKLKIQIRFKIFFDGSIAEVSVKEVKASCEIREVNQSFVWENTHEKPTEKR